jgi:flagellar motility protein MotE (MotC chaperone)
MPEAENEELPMSGRKWTFLVMGGIGVAVFGISFGLSRWLGRGPAPAAGAPAQTSTAAPAPRTEPNDPFAEATRLEERHLYDLVKEVRRKLRECHEREERLVQEENRLRLVREELRKEAQELENIRVQAAAALSGLKEAKARLDKDRLQIRRDEETNLKRTAAVYDRMDATSAAKIIEGMCRGAQQDDAVKILHFMSERAVAKVLGEIAAPDVAAGLSQRLKAVAQEAVAKP